MKTPMSSDTKLTKDEECKSVDSTKYRGMIGSLLYLTASRPDIMFSVCLCARFQEAPKTSYLEAVKRIFQYIKGTTHLGLWYPKGTDIETVVYADSDHAGDYVDRNSTSGICTFVGCCLTSWFSEKQAALAISTTEAEYGSNWSVVDYKGADMWGSMWKRVDGMGAKFESWGGWGRWGGGGEGLRGGGVAVRDGNCDNGEGGGGLSRSLGNIVLISFIILSDLDDEVTTFPVRPAPPSPDYVLTLLDYSLDSDLDSDPLEDDSPGEDLTETVESLHTHTTLTSVVYPLPSLLPSSSLLPPSLLPSLSHKRPRSPSPSPPSVPSLPSVLPPPPERIELVGDDVQTLCASLASAKQETVTLCARVRGLELRDFRVTDRLEILELRSRSEYAETRLERSYDRPTGDGVCTQRVVMIEQEPNKLLAEIKKIIAQRVASTIETIAIYETKTRMALDSRNQVKRQEDKVTENASNKRKWEGNHGRSSSQQRNKGHEVIGAHDVGPSNKKFYVGKLPQ
ncbi:hypothetical protein Tco_0231761 [Tanacetum coccineum]